MPLSYFSHLFGHEGENSLLSYLKKEGLAMELCAGDDHELDVFSDFYVDITLTKKGLAEYTRVIDLTFAYAKRLNEVGPAEFVYEESKILGQINFDFAAKGDSLQYCVSNAKTMISFKNDEDMAHLLRKKYGPQQFDKERTKEIAGLMASSENTLIFLSSKSFEGENMEKERWYNVPWMKEKYSTERIAAMKDTSAPDKSTNGLKLDLPPANDLLPKNFDILPNDPEQSAKPIRVIESDLVDLWYKKDD